MFRTLVCVCVVYVVWDGTIKPLCIKDTSFIGDSAAKQHFFLMHAQTHICLFDNVYGYLLDFKVQISYSMTCEFNALGKLTLK